MYLPEQVSKEILFNTSGIINTGVCLINLFINYFSYKKFSEEITI